MLQAEQIQENWNKLRGLINDWFPERADALNKLYDEFEDRISIMPASSALHLHNAFPGGYVDHVLRVVDCSLQMYETFKASGASVDGFELSELVFAAIHHDLGKMGFPENGGEVYQPNDSEWHKKNQGKMYKINPNNPFSMVPDLSIFILQHYGVKMSWNELQAIRVHDGLYEEANKPYFLSRTADSKFKTNLPMILHFGDYMAARIEFEAYYDTRPTMPKPKRKTAKNTFPEASKEKLDELFENLFE